MGLNFDDMPLRKLGKYFWLAWFTASMGQFVDAYDTLIIGAALLYLDPLWKLTASQTGLLASSAFIGVAVGAPLFGAFADRIGRRLLYIWDLIFLVVFGFLSAFAANFVQLYILRLLIGIGVGGDYALSPTMVAEYAPAKRRGFALASMNSFWGIGSVVGFLSAFAFAVAYGGNPNLAWRVMLGSEAIWGLIIIILRMGILESPRWAAIQEKIGQKIKETHEDVVKKMTGGSEASLDPGKPGRPSLKALFEGNMWKTTLFIWVWWPVADIAFYGSNLYTPYITKGLGLTTPQLAFLASALYWVIALFGYYTAAVTYDKWGRRFMVIVGALVMGIDMVAGLVMYELGLFGTNLAFPLIMILFTIYYYFMNFGPGPYTVALAELWPTRVRATGHGLASMFSRIGAAASTYVLPVLVKQIGYSGAFALLGGAILFVALWSYLLMPETKQLTPTQIEDKLTGTK
ncbi:MFS transporter [Thermocladium modestius]|uniref:MFS transporter n=1 Tax=Thermocladium modestius TaxID=62609 RepID=A0A830GVZ1_9CREN|nr:MFS transporter [Thermocladium modestius]GGP20948.1 MFS transporter [Thermocladium modestius]